MTLLRYVINQELIENQAELSIQYDDSCIVTLIGQRRELVSAGGSFRCVLPFGFRCATVGWLMDNFTYPVPG